jgi:hypothetical protein
MLVLKSMIVISDHSHESCIIKPIENTLSDRIWTMDIAHLQDKKCIKYVNEKIKTTVLTGRPFWDAFKAYIRGMIISYSAKVQSELEVQIKQPINISVQGHEETNISELK